MTDRPEFLTPHAARVRGDSGRAWRARANGPRPRPSTGRGRRRDAARCLRHTFSLFHSLSRARRIVQYSERGPRSTRWLLNIYQTGKPMDQQRIEGGLRKTTGTIKQEAGEALGDRHLQTE